MVFGFDQTNFDAVLFVDQNKVIKEMLLTEFEAVLDGVVGEPEFADTTCHAVYLKIDLQLNIVGAVFFLITFDNKGAADRRWNIPLAQMVETAAFGLELNGVRLRIACRSQCQIPWHQQDLWEPDLSIGSSTLKMLSTSIKANRLGLLVDNAGAPPLLHHSIESSGTLIHDHDIGEDARAVREMCEGISDGQGSDAQSSREEERYRMAQNIKKQRLFIASLKARQQVELEGQRAQFAKDLESMATTTKALQLSNDDLDKNYARTMAELEDKEQLFKRQSSEYETQIARVLDQHGVNHKELKEQYQKDFRRKLIEQTSKLEEKLEMREVEVFYREEQINRFKKEIADLQSQCKKLQSQTVDSEIVSLVEHGVHFVITQPGLGPISIESKDLSSFNASPNAYLADRLGVELQTYEAWLAHVKSPLCLGDLRTGEACGASVEEVSTPQEFVSSVSDRCSVHQQSNLTAVNGR